jgi:hypothetical protein
MFNKTNDPSATGRMTKPVNFYLAAPSAQSVYLVGDFNWGTQRLIPCGAAWMAGGISKYHSGTAITDIGSWWMAIPCLIH